ncbi:MAG TPA: arylamine N-acetyltransferase [Allosphingosinicella sp.]|nr:arylamine N-acetyltransferase [Allosphingosinicella sp.]
MKLTPAQLDAYFARIGIAAPARADAAALAAIHRAHALAFTWEAADAFLMRPEGGIDPARAFERMVTGRRGGWCYEMNGLLGAALAGAGFAVTRLCCGVHRATLGEAAIGNHLSLRVELEDGPWLVEAGLGDALPVPIPLRAGAHEQGFLASAIEPADGEWLRYVNHRHGVASSFDFRPDYADEAVLAATEVWMRTDPGSPFTGALAIMRHFPDRIESLVNRTRRTLGAAGLAEREIEDEADFAATLAGPFALDHPDVPALWAKTGEVVARARAAA